MNQYLYKLFNWSLKIFNFLNVLRKQISQLESEKRYLEKSNRHLEKILEATNAYKNQVVSELNRIQVGTPKVRQCDEYVEFVLSNTFCCVNSLNTTDNNIITNYVWH